jgi:uncharacterized protein
MIVDCFTHTWESNDQLGRCTPARGQPLSPVAQGIAQHGAGRVRHQLASEPVGVTLVLGFKSYYLDADIPNDAVAEYVARHPDRLIGLAGVDPTRPREAIAEMTRAREELRMPGIAVAPAAQGMHPTTSHAMLVYAEAADRNMPVLFHSGVFLAAETKLEFAQPVLLDEVARELPRLKVVIAHLGFPWLNETIALLAKHPNLYAEISWLVHQPWQAYQALLSAWQYGVMHKLLFGSGFPAATASQCIEALYSINHLVHETNLPTIPREALRGIVERDALGLLGIPRPHGAEVSATHEQETDEDEMVNARF